MVLQTHIFLQAGILAAGLRWFNKKINPGKPLHCNMYEDYTKYPDLPKLPNELGQSLEQSQCYIIKQTSRLMPLVKKQLMSYIKLRSSGN